MLALFGNLDLAEMGIAAVVAIMIFGRDLPKVAARIAVHLGRMRRQMEQMWRDAGIDREVREVQAEIRKTTKNLDPRALTRAATATIERELDEQDREIRAAVAGEPPAATSPDTSSGTTTETSIGADPDGTNPPSPSMDPTAAVGAESGSGPTAAWGKGVSAEPGAGARRVAEAAAAAREAESSEAVTESAAEAGTGDETHKTEE